MQETIIYVVAAIIGIKKIINAKTYLNVNEERGIKDENGERVRMAIYCNNRGVFGVGVHGVLAVVFTIDRNGFWVVFVGEIFLLRAIGKRAQRKRNCDGTIQGFGMELHIAKNKRGVLAKGRRIF